METSASDLEGRTFVPWWAGPLAAALVIVTGLLCFATAVCLVSLCIMAVAAVLGKIGRPGIEDPLMQVIPLMLGVLLSIALSFLCVTGANWLGNPTHWRSRYVHSHRCPWCRYDIRGLPQQRCPECGETW